MPRKKTHDEFIQELKNKNPNIIPIDKYINNTTKITFQCLKCGNVYQTIPKIVLSGHACPNCGKQQQGLSRRKTSDDFCKQLQNINPNIKLLSSYVKSNEKVKCKCLIDGCEWEATPNNLLKGSGCPKCKTNKLKNLLTSNTDEFIKKAIAIHDNKYDYSKVKYVTNEIPVCIICPKHGEFWQTPHLHLSGRGCNKCNNSKGELNIIKHLTSKNIKFEQQKQLNISTTIRKSGNIFVDFYLPELNTIIEYNGIQHYIPQKHFGGELKFNKQIERDNWLKNYCNFNGIRLIEIPYNQNVDTILNQYL